MKATDPNAVQVGPRQAMVLELVRDGRTARQIMVELDLSPARVYQHITALRRKGLLPPAGEVA